jgi:hypothetical protein
MEKKDNVEVVSGGNDAVKYANMIDRESGKPLGGWASGLGLNLTWQSGPVKEVGKNGAQVEDLIEVLIARLDFFQEGAYRCKENGEAIEYLIAALEALRERTKNRINRGVEGTNVV